MLHYRSSAVKSTPPIVPLLFSSPFHNLLVCNQERTVTCIKEKHTVGLADDKVFTGAVRSQRLHPEPGWSLRSAYQRAQ